jgi:hypothetical protein
VAPATPLTPETVVSPVSVVVSEPLVTTEVQVLVVMGEALSPEPAPEPNIVVTDVVTKVEEPLVMVVTTDEVATGAP